MAITTEETDTPKQVGFMQSVEAALESGRDRIRQFGRDSGSLLANGATGAGGGLFKSVSGSQRSETAQEQMGEGETEADEESSEGSSQPWAEMVLARVTAPIRTGPMRVGGFSMAIMAVIVYALLVFAIGYGYAKVKAGATKGDFLGRLADKEKLAPQEGFSDGICDCGSSLPITLTACLIPCVRWSDTVNQAKLMQTGFYQALGIFTACLLVNTFLSGIGTLLVVILGTAYRIKIRQTYDVPTSTQTHALDFLAWLCCTPCAIAQEARHVERNESLGLKTTTSA